MHFLRSVSQWWIKDWRKLMFSKSTRFYKFLVPQCVFKLFLKPQVTSWEEMISFRYRYAKFKDQNMSSLLISKDSIQLVQLFENSNNLLKHVKKYKMLKFCKSYGIVNSYYPYFVVPAYGNFRRMMEGQDKPQFNKVRVFSQPAHVHIRLGKLLNSCVTAKKIHKF